MKSGRGTEQERESKSMKAELELCSQDFGEATGMLNSRAWSHYQIYILEAHSGNNLE